MFQLWERGPFAPRLFRIFPCLIFYKGHRLCLFFWIDHGCYSCLTVGFFRVDKWQNAVDS